jgi:DNA-binding LacI/PurR family transcriptional regulator
MADKGRRRVNISEVAKAAGVSKMTVSRMFNDAAKVAPATRAKVQKIIDKLQYQPNLIARGLVTNRTGIIGFLAFEELESVFFHEILWGVQYAAGLSEYNLLIFSKPNGKKVLNNRHLSLMDGVLCMGTYMDEDTFETFERDNIPYLVIGRRNWRKVDPWYYGVDYVNGFYDATRYLMNMGHRRIVMIGGVRNYEPDADKYAGVRKALIEADLPFYPETVVYEDKINTLREMMETYKPTAVIVGGIKMLFAFLICAKDMKLSIPKQLSIISTSRDIDVHTLYNLTGIYDLTLAEVPRRELGIKGLQSLVKIIKGEEGIPKAQRIPIKFTEGGSCAPPEKRE